MKLSFNKSLRWGIVLSLLIYIVISYPGFYPIPDLTANALSHLLNFMGIPSKSYGTYLIVGFRDLSRILELSAECSGVLLFSIFLFVVFTLPDFSIKHRLTALFFIPLLLTINLIRIAIGIIGGYYFSVGFLVFFHNTIGQVLMFFGIISTYLIWLHLVGHFPKERQSYKKDLDF